MAICNISIANPKYMSSEKVEKERQEPFRPWLLVLLFPVSWVGEPSDQMPPGASRAVRGRMRNPSRLRTSRSGMSFSSACFEPTASVPGGRRRSCARPPWRHLGHRRPRTAIGAWQSRVQGPPRGRPTRLSCRAVARCSGFPVP